MVHPGLHHVRSLGMQHHAQMGERAALQVCFAFEVVQRRAGIAQALRSMRPRAGVHSDDDAAKARGIERLDKIDEHRLRTTTADTVGEVQDRGSLVLGEAGGRHRDRRGMRAHGGEGQGKHRGFSRWCGDGVHDRKLMKVLLAERRQVLTASKAPETVASASHTDSGVP